MCRLLHVEWRCKHKQNIWEYCAAATAPSRTPSVTERSKQPCDAFVQKYTLTPSGPAADEYRNFCCKFVCCLEDQADTFKQVQDLEIALGMTANDKVSRLPSVFLSRQQKALREARKKFGLLLKRHEERCEALYYGLGVVQEGDTWRAPAEGVGLKGEKKLSKDEEKESGNDAAVEGREIAGEAEVVEHGEQLLVEQMAAADSAAPDKDYAQGLGDQFVSKA